MALDLGLLHDFTDSVPGALAKLPDQLHQLFIHFFREARDLLFDILFALEDAAYVLIRILRARFGGTLQGSVILGGEDFATEVFEGNVVLGGLLGVGCPVRLVDDHLLGRLVQVIG